MEIKANKDNGKLITKEQPQHQLPLREMADEDLLWGIVQAWTSRTNHERWHAYYIVWRAFQRTRPNSSEGD